MSRNQTRSEELFAGPKTVHLYSSLTNDQLYPVYEKKIDEGPNGQKRQVNVIVAHVFVEGGAHRMDKRLDTPIGKLTSVSEKALEFLQTSHVFREHVKNGYVTVRRDQVDIERAVAAHTSERDPSAPLTPEDWMNEDPNTTPIPSTKGADVGKGRKVSTRRQAEWK
jgi:hypothetical protein